MDYIRVIAIMVDNTMLMAVVQSYHNYGLVMVLDYIIIDILHTYSFSFIMEFMVLLCKDLHLQQNLGKLELRKINS
jgi:hypothetical protein